MKRCEQELAKQREIVSSQEALLTKAAKEVEVLARALEIRGEELGLHGDVRSSLLYEVAQRKQEAHTLAMELAARTGAWERRGVGAAAASTRGRDPC